MTLIGFLLLMLDTAQLKVQAQYEPVPYASDFIMESPCSAVQDHLGRVYVLDRDAKTIFIWDENHKFLKTLGRPGRGPGEFELPNAAFLHLHENRLYVVDGLRRKVHEFHDLEFEKTHKLSFGRISKSEITANGDFVMEFQNFRGASPVTEVWLLDRNFQKQKLLASDPEISWQRNEKGGWTYRPYSGEHMFFAHTKLNFILLGHTYERSLQVLSLQGEPVERFDFEIPKIPMNDQIKQATSLGTILESPDNEVLFPEYLHYYSMISAAPVGVFLLNLVGPDSDLHGYVIKDGEVKAEYREKLGEGGLILHLYPGFLRFTLNEEGDYQFSYCTLEMVSKSGPAKAKASFFQKE